MEADDDEFLLSKHLRHRYKKTDRTLARWVEDGVLPAPLMINGRLHWRRSEIEQREREGMSRRHQPEDTAA
jgi:hypothetical protein